MLNRLLSRKRSRLRINVQIYVHTSRTHVHTNIGIEKLKQSNTVKQIYTLNSAGLKMNFNDNDDDNDTGKKLLCLFELICMLKVEIEYRNHFLFIHKIQRK